MKFRTKLIWQAAGLPVVSCATRGVPDVVQHGQTGLLARQIDARLLAACVRTGFK